MEMTIRDQGGKLVNVNVSPRGWKPWRKDNAGHNRDLERRTDRLEASPDQRPDHARLKHRSHKNVSWSESWTPSGQAWRLCSWAGAAETITPAD